MNTDLAKIFQDMATFLDMQEVPFSPRAFEKAAYSLEALEQDVADIYKKGGLKALEEISGVGKGIAGRIEEYIKTGKIKDYIRLKKEIPVNLDDLSAIEGMGPKTIFKLYKKLRIKDRKDLEKAVRAGKLRKLEGFGQKTEENILKSIELHKSDHGRFTLGQIMPVVNKILTELKKISGVERAEVAGSTRRRQETVGDIDILVISKDPKKVMDFFVSMPEVVRVHANGDTKSSVHLSIGINADLRVLPPESWGAALQYFTGDKYHNVAVRQIAIKQGLKLSEYGLFKGKRMVAGATEEDIYAKLGMSLIPPEMRTNNGEIDAALRQAQGKLPGLPKLIEYNDIKGDLQIQTSWTDGQNTIEEMAQAAIALGHEYICITDHTKSLAMTGGSDERKLLRQMKEIDKINSKLQKTNPNFRILKGAEVNIMKDGTLDINDETLAKLDVVGAAVHSSFNMPEAEMTARIIRAIENPNIDIIFHPTGRILQRRPPYALNMDEIIKAAKRTGTVLEIDAFPDRLDLKDEYIRKAIQAGVKLSIDTDAHSIVHLHYMEYGIAQARRGWAEKKDIINAWPLEKMLGMLKER
jgi:DNA polymerase (family 10)